MARDLIEYQRDLSCIICACKELYDNLTRDAPPDDKVLEWQEFCEYVDRKCFVPMLATLEKNRAGVWEICVAALEFLEFAAASVRLLHAPPNKGDACL